MNTRDTAKKKTGHRVGRRLLAVLAVLLLLLAGGLFVLNLYLNTSGVRERLRAEASSQLGTEVAIGDLRVSLWKGFYVRDVTIHSALPGLPDPVSVAEARLGYRLAGLFRRRLAISELVLKKPVVSLVRDGEGRWNLPLLPAAAPEPEVEPERLPAGLRERRITVPAAPPPEREPSAWGLSVDSLRLEDLSFEYELDPPLGRVRLEGLDIESRFAGVGEDVEIKGSLKLARGAVEGVPWVERLSLDFKLKERVLGVSSLRAELFEGRLGGEFSVLPLEEEAGDTIPLGVEGNLDFSGLRPARFLQALGVDFLAGGSIDAGLRFRGALPLPEAELELTASGLKLEAGTEIDRARLEIAHSGGDIRAETIQISSWGGEIGGNLSTSLRDPGQPWPVNGRLELKDLETEKLLPPGEEGPPLRGKVGGELELAGVFSPDRNILPRVEGELLSDRLEIRDFGVAEAVRLPVDLRDNILNSREMSALLGGGRVRGDIESDLRDPARVSYRADLTVEDVDLEKLQAGLKEKPGTGLSGRVNGRAVFSGVVGETGSLEGEGGAELKEGSISGHPIQKVVAGLTGIGRLERIDFDRADVKFRAVDGALKVTEAVARSEEIRIDGSGRVGLEPDHELDFKVRLSFHEGLVRQLSPRELRLALRPAHPGDEFRGLEFRIWGTPENVRSDYLEVLARSAAVGLLERELRRRIGEEE